MDSPSCSSDSVEDLSPSSRLVNKPLNSISTAPTPSTTAASTSPATETSESTRRKKIKPLPIESTVSGAVAGLVSRLVIAPLDVVKIRLQLDVSQNPSTQGRKIFNKLTTIVRQEGFTALFKGNVPAGIMYITYGASQFTTYKWSSMTIETSFPTLSEPVKSFAAGSMSATVATTLTYPFDLLRTRFAIQATPGNTKVYPNLRYAIWHIYKHEGLNGYFRGLTPALLAMVPYMGLFFASYEQINNGLHYIIPDPPTNNGSKNIGTQEGVPAVSGVAASSVLSVLRTSREAIAGLAAGLVAKTALFPLDVVRKRIQVQGPTRHHYLSGSIPYYPRNPFFTALMIARKEGFFGLYKGLFVSLIKSAPASAVTMWTYEHTLEAMRYFKARGFLNY